MREIARQADRIDEHTEIFRLLWLVVLRSEVSRTVSKTPA